MLKQVFLLLLFFFFVEFSMKLCNGETYINRFLLFIYDNLLFLSSEMINRYGFPTGPISTQLLNSGMS